MTDAGPPAEDHGIRVLVVDDNPRYRRGIERALGRRDEVAAVVGAEDGEQALRAARLHRPDVVLVDQRMPGLTGLDVVRALRDDRALATVGIVLTSADPTAELTAAARATGATACIDKAASRSAICDAVLAAAGG